MRETDYPALTATELARTGHALYGAQWRAPLAHALNLPDEGLIRAVEAGAIEAPDDWRGQLIALAQNVALRAMDTANTLLWSVSDRSDETHSAEVLRLA